MGPNTYRSVVARSLACGFESFKRQVVKRLHSSVGQEAPLSEVANSATGRFGELDRMVKERANSSQSPLICVSAGAVDRQIGQDLLGLLDELGAEAMLAPEPNPELPISVWWRQYKQALIECDGLLVVYGRTQPSWVLSRLALSRKMIAGLLVEQPRASLPRGILLHNMRPLDCRNGLSLTPILTYLEKIRQD